MVFIFTRKSHFCSNIYFTTDNYCKSFIIHFKDPVKLSAEEMMEVALNFSEPGLGGSYQEISWYENQTGSPDHRIVFLHQIVTEGKPLYYNEFCSGSSPCDTSSKVELNVDSGDLTIYNVTISDQGFYYYYFYMDGNVNTGHKYEIHVEIYGNSIATVLKVIPNICTKFSDSRGFEIRKMSIKYTI